MNKYTTANWLSNSGSFLTILLICSAVLFQNCSRDDEEPTITYLCLPENFNNDCEQYKNIPKSTGYGNTGFEIAAPTFIPGNSDELIFIKDNNDDKLEPSQVMRYNWRTEGLTVLIEESPMIHRCNIAKNGWVCAEVSSGPIVYFHIDSASTTLQEVPYNNETVKTPAWLSDGETIVYMADNQDLDFNIYSFNTKSGKKKKHKILAENVTNALIPSMSETDHFVVSVIDDGYYKMAFNDLKDMDLLIKHENTAPFYGGGRGMHLLPGSRIYYAGHWDINVAENNHQYMIRNICFGGELIQDMDVSDDEKYIVYTFEYPVDFTGGKQILALKMRIIDIENCKEYDINPFE